MRIGKHVCAGGGMAVALAFWGLGLTAPAMAAGTASVSVHVGPNGSDTTGSGSASAPYRTIAKALGVAPAGATVILAPGTYKESITIDRTVTLESDAAAGGSAANTVIDASGHAHAIVVDGAAADGSAIEGLTVEDASGIGVLVENTKRITIEHDVITHNAAGIGAKVKGEYKGLQMEGVSDSTIDDNTVTANAHGGIRLADSPSNVADRIDAWLARRGE